jgi:hypothetical protein
MRYLMFIRSAQNVDDFIDLVGDCVATSALEAVEEMFPDPEGSIKTRWYIHRLHDAASVCRSARFGTVLAVRFRD